MNKIFSGLLLALTLIACTSEESKIRSVALEEARRQLRTELVAKASEKISGKENLKQAYADQVIERSEFEVLHVDQQGLSAKVRVDIHMVPAKIQNAVTDIINALNPSKENAFNVGDAISLVYQKMNVDPKSTVRTEKIIDLRKKNSDWQAIK